MDHISRVIPRVLSKRGLSDHAVSALVVFRSQQWMSNEWPVLANAIRVHSLRDGVLTVHCSHSIAAQECQTAIPRLLEFIHTNCQNAHVTNVRVNRAGL